MSTTARKVAAIAVFGLSLFFVASQAVPAAAQTKPSVNLTKQVLDAKKTIVWKDAPANTFPGDVCNIIQSCGGAIKLIAIPAATEKGVKVARGLFWAQSSDGKHTDLVVLERQTPTDATFYLLGADGGLVRAAYLDEGAPVKRWVSMGAALLSSQFANEVMTWNKRVTEITSAPPPKPADN